MSEIRANGLLTLTGVIDETESGPWTARVEVDDDAGKITGAVTIVAGAQSFTGTVAKGRVDNGRYVAEIVGGKNGLQKVLPAKHYVAVTARNVLDDVMRESGESLDTANSDPGILSYQLAHWTRTKGEARLALQALATELGAYWRVSRAGLVVIVKDDKWTAQTGAYVEEGRDPSRSEVVIAPDEPFARPGVTVGGERVVTAHTRWDDGGLRQLLQIHDGTDKAQDQAAVIADLARRANENAIAYGRCYPSKVVAQSADGSLQVVPDDERVKGLGASRVPPVYGIPGTTAKVLPGSRVRLRYDCSDPRQPVCSGWDADADAAELAFRALQIKLSASGAPAYSFVKGEALMAYLDTLTQAIITALNLITPGPATGGGAPAAASLSAQLAAFEALQTAALSLIIKGE